MADGTSDDARPDRGGRTRTGRKRAASASGEKRTATAAPKKRPAGPRTIPAPKILADPDGAAVRLTLMQEMQSAYRRDPLGFAIDVLKHLVPLLLWITFFFVMFGLSLVAYNYISKADPSLEFGWLTDAEVRARTQTSGPVKLDGFPVNTPRETGTNEGETNPMPGEAGGGAGETEAKPVDVGTLLNDRREWELAIQATGGNDKTRAAINRGLAWLTRQQHRDGHWQFDDPQLYPDGSEWVDWKTHTGATSMALMAFLGAGHTHRNGDHQKTVEKGLDWLIGQQEGAGRLDEGDFFDRREVAGRPMHFFAHAMGTIAICEAYALTKDPKLRPPAELAVKFLVESQHPTKGGWGYQPLRDEESEAYMWVTGWGLMAMFTARAAGIEIEHEAFQRTSRFVDSVMVQQGAGYKNRSHPGDPPQPSLVAEGLLTRQYLGWERDHPALINGTKVLLDPSHRPAWKPGQRDLYAWYHQAEVLHNLGGDDFKDWYAHTQQLIVDAQQDGPRNAPNDVNGSWHPMEPNGPVFEVSDNKLGRLYTTSLCLLILESPFRHMPVYPEEG